MSKNIFLFQIKKQLATMQAIKTAHGDIDISNDVTIQAHLEKLLYRHLKKVVDEAYESGEQVDWLIQSYQDHKEHVRNAHADLAEKEKETVQNQIKSMKDDVDSMLKRLDESGVLTNQKSGDSLNGEVVLDNPRPTGDGKNNAKSPNKKPPEAK